MMRSKPACGRGIVLLGAMVMAATTTTETASAAVISWEKRGAFETCLEERANDWVNAKATLVLNDDPAVSEIDDMDVAIWAVDALQVCERQTGQTNLMSEGRFSIHMAHWREHIHSIAQTVRQRVGAD